MANNIINPIEGYTESWENHTGAEVEAFLKTEMQRLDGTTPSVMDFVPAEDGTKGTLSIAGKDGSQLASVVIPMGAMTGEGTIRTSLQLTTASGSTVIRKGDGVTLNVSYDNRYVGGDNGGQSTGYQARLQVTVKNGSTVKFTASATRVACGSTQIFNVPGTAFGPDSNDVLVTATVTDPTTGEEKTSTAYMRIKALDITLSTSFDMASANTFGGFGPEQAVEIPYTVTGSGSKNILVYVDGIQKQVIPVTKSGVTNGTVDVKQFVASLGRHNIQLVATVEEEGVTVRSQSVYLDIWRVNALGATVPHVCLKFERGDGAVFDSTAFASPVLPAVQYETLSAEYTAYTPANATGGIVIEEYETGLTTPAASYTLAPDRGLHSHVMRFLTQGAKTVKIKIDGGQTVAFGVDVAKSAIDVSEFTQGRLFKLSASGRSNSESNPAKWEATDKNGAKVSTTFDGMLFGQTDGWHDNALHVLNGASAEIGHKPFAADIRRTGYTLEVTFRASNVVDPELPVLSCIEDGKGILITGGEVSFLTGSSVTSADPEDPNRTISRPLKISSTYPAGEWIKAAFVFHPDNAAGGRLMELYVNGDRVAADIYTPDFTFVQTVPKPLRVESRGADVALRTVRAYTMPVGDDECVNNWIADLPTFAQMQAAYQANDWLDSAGGVDINKLIAEGKGVVKVVRANKMTDIYATNDKSKDFLADVYFYSPFGAAHSFVARNIYIRIQGTSSTLYPSKNLRVYFTKGAETRSFECETAANNPKKWPLRPGGTCVDLVCLKSDYVDSSMSNNTGGARLFNDTMLKLGIMTPPQRHQYTRGGNDVKAVTARTAIDGYPVDLFVAETPDGSAEYMGCYNLNYDKKNSGKIWGVTGVEGMTPACPLVLESLNNSERGCLFQTTSDADAAAGFDTAFEVTYGINAAGKETDAIPWAELPQRYRDAYLGLMRFVRECVPANADTANLTSFASEKFRLEAAGHFDLDNLCAAYLLKYRDAAVDQFAKNILWTTWDGVKWYYINYDGDTQLGSRNDVFLKYLYNVLREDWDAEVGKYAFEGHDSWLWCLLLANFGTELKAMANRLSRTLTAEGALAVYNGEQTEHWSLRAMNRSGYVKYIKPAKDGVANFMYGVKGTMVSHKAHFIANRYKLFDALYQTDSHTDDCVNLYMSRSQSADMPDAVRITAADVYAFGYGTNNRKHIASTSVVAKGATATLQIAETYTNNDPLRIYGASRIKALDMSGSAASHLSGGLDLRKCEMLRSLDLSLDDTTDTVPAAMFINFGQTRSLQHINLRGQRNARTSAGSTVMDLSGQTRLETLDMRGCDNTTGVVIADGAPVTSLRLPRNLTSLTLRNLRKLTPAGLTFEGYSQLRDIELSGCSGIDDRALITTVMAKAPNLRSVRCHNIDWSGLSLAEVLKLADMRADITGVITLQDSAAVNFDAKRRLNDAWGSVDSDANPLRIVHTGRTELTAVGIGGATYIGTVGDYRMTAVPTPVGANVYRGFRWAIDANDYATIDPATGVLTVRAVATDGTTPTATVRLTAVKLDGTELTATQDVGFYARIPQPGDFVYADGTTSDILDRSKTAVGFCLFVDPDAPTTPGRRVAMTLGSMGTYQWGVDNDAKIVDAQGVEHFIGDVPDVPNQYDNMGVSNGSMRNSDNSDFKAFSTTQAIGQVGIVQTEEAIGDLPAYSRVPWGVLRTLQILKHRDMILEWCGLPIPTPAPGRTMTAALTNEMQKTAVKTNNNALYHRIYYPAASYANAYEPTVKEGETLADCFRQGKWGLCTEGELARAIWYHNNSTVLDKVKASGLLASLTQNQWTSNEHSVHYACYWNGSWFSYNNKFYTYAVRAVAAF